MTNNDSSNLFESMADALEELLRRLRADRTALDQHIQRVESDLARLRREFPSASASPSPEAAGTSRRPRGANRKAVRDLFSQNPGLALTLSDIADRLSMPRSSTQAALKRLSEIEQCEDGLYRWRSPQNLLDEN